MKDEKTMIEYKESKGLFQRLKSMFEKIKERFSKKPQEPSEIKISNKVQDDQELTEEELDKVKAGFQLNEVTMEDLITDLGIDSKKTNSWDLTKEEKEDVEKGYEEIKNENNQELSEEELDNVTAGHPIIDEEEYNR